MKSTKMAVMLLVVMVLSSNVFAASWSTSNGWVTKGGSKFFALGAWLELEDFDTSTELTNRCSNLNLMQIQSPYDASSYMNSKVIMTGNEMFNYYLQNDRADGEFNFTFSNTDSWITKSSMNALKQNDTNTTFQNWLEDHVIDPIFSAMSSRSCSDFLVYKFDEADRNKTNWYVPREVLTAYSSKLSTEDDNDLNVTGLGPIAGNRYHYSCNMNPSGPLSDPGDNEYKDSYVSLSTYTGNTTLSNSAYSSNVGLTVDYYESATDLFILNSYSAFKSDPAYAGKTVNAVKSYTSDALWLWFDIFGIYSSTSTYNNLRCQIYTAISQGCTGVLFYGLDEDRTGNGNVNNVFTADITTANSLAGEINSHVDKFQYITDKGVVSSDVYYGIFDTGGTQYLLLANTSSSSRTVNMNDISGISLSTTSITLSGYGVGLYQQSTSTSLLKAASPSDLEPVNLLEPTTVEDEAPGEFAISASPNPFNPSTTITYSLPSQEHVRLDVYSLSGQKVATLVDGDINAGAHSAVFDGAGLASGIYVYRFAAGSFAQNGKITLVK